MTMLPPGRIDPTIKNHVGTATGGSSSVTWNTQYVPDQGGDIKILARIRNGNGVWYVIARSDGSDAAEFRELREAVQTSGYCLNAPGHGVILERSYPCRHPRQRQCWQCFGSGWLRAHMERHRWCAGAERLQLPEIQQLGRWRVRREPRLLVRYQELPDLTIALGLHDIHLVSSNILHHGIEILWPGPGLIVRYGGSSSNVGPSITSHPSNQSVTVGGTATFNVGATGTPSSGTNGRKTIRISAARSDQATQRRRPLRATMAPPSGALSPMTTAMQRVIPRR